MASQGATLIQLRYKRDANPCTTLKKVIEKTGLKPWPKLLQNLRATRETELLAKYPTKDVTSWLGNSPTIAHKHYAMATDEAFSRGDRGDDDLDTSQEALRLCRTGRVMMRQARTAIGTKARSTRRKT